MKMISLLGILGVKMNNAAINKRFDALCVDFELYGKQ